MVKHLLLLFVSLFTLSNAAVASDQVWKEKDKCLFVKLADGGMDAYKSGTASVSNGKLTVTYSGGTATYEAGTYTGCSNEVPVMPTMTTYKFNNKYNHELFSDVVAQVSNNMTLNVNQIGHYLTASFNLSDRKAVAYVGTTLQESKVTRQSFKNAVTYTVTYPGYNLVTDNGKVPFGNDYTVNVNWLIDNATAVARIDINIKGGVTEITDAMKETYQTATFTLTGNGAFEDMKDVAMKIKGRGNSSWENEKKPYRIKFDKGQKPFGLTKGKSWVLLANAQNGSFLTNAIAHKIGAMIGVPYTNHSVPVELYLSGEYKGTYMFTEHRSINGNSVEINDTTSYLIELDTNDKGDDKADVISADNDDIYFNSSNITLPVVIKDPDLVDWAGKYGQDAAKQKMNDIKNDFNALTAVLKNKSASADLTPYLDLDIAARYILAYDLSLNNEAGHPKSIFMWKENFWQEDGTTLNPNAGKMMFGPVWDFDWAFGYGKKSWYGMYSYFDSNRVETAWLTLTSSDLYGGQKGYGRDFFNAILVNNEFKRHYYNVWNEFQDEAMLTELADYIQAYYNYAQASFDNSVKKGKDSSFDYATQVTTASTWLKDRANYLVGKLTTSNVDDLAYPTVGDTDVNGVLSVRDIAVIGTDYDNEKKADVDGNGTAGNAADKAAAAEIVAAAGYLPPMHYYQTGMVAATLSAADVNVAPGESATIPVSLSLNNSTAFRAMQAEIVLPQGVTLNGVTKGSGISNKSLLCVEAGEGAYRVVIYGTDTNTFGNGVLLNLDVTLATDAVVPGTIMIEDVVAVNSSYSEVRLPDLAIAYDKAEVILDYYCLNDGVVYDNTVQQKYKKIDYKRNFKNTNWQALYVPFAIDCDAISDKFHIAIIKDENEGDVASSSLEIMYAPEGYVTEPNTPYFIKALTTGEQTITMEYVVLHPAQENSVVCELTDAEYVFTGTYKGLQNGEMFQNQYYALSGGALCYASSANVKLGAQRWYLDIVTNGANPHSTIGIRVLDGTTGIVEVEGEEAEVTVIYDLAGRRIDSITTPGIYIVNGKKTLVK